jgi:hypothetical protein
MQDGVKRVREKFSTEQITLIHIKHPVEDCIASVRDRGHRIKEETIRKIEIKIETNMRQFRDLGYTTYELDRASALNKVRAILSS